MKNPTIEKTSLQLSQIYKDLGAEKRTLGDMVKMRDLKSMMSISSKDRFMAQPKHSKLVQQASALNRVSETLVNQLKMTKMDYGLQL